MLLPGELSRAKSTQELRQMAQAGASLIINLDQNKLSISELRFLAQSLNGNATLTIKSEKQDALPTTFCVQLAREHPGKIIFWF